MLNVLSRLLLPRMVSRQYSSTSGLLSHKAEESCSASGYPSSSHNLNPGLFQGTLAQDHPSVKSKPQHARVNSIENQLPLCHPSSLETLYERLQIASSSTLNSEKRKQYILPASVGSIFSKKTILDPELIPRSYKLPTYINNSQEKFTPGTESQSPKVDPHPLQKAIDEGVASITKVTMPFLVNIRRRKMKKHKLKKFRKRMIFLHRKLTEIKKRKKQQKLLEYKRSMLKSGEEFDAEKYVDEQLNIARQGGYKLNIFSTRR